MKPLMLLAAIILSSACATSQTTPVPVRLQVPPPLVLPKIRAEELSCLSDDTYSSLVRIVKMLKARNETLENIIRTTQP